MMLRRQVPLGGRSVVLMCNNFAAALGVLAHTHLSKALG
jgi:hypothetical protein